MDWQPALSTAFCNGYAGSVGNNLTLALQGTLPIPPPPGAPTVSTLTATPTSPQLTGTSVTLADTITTTASPAPSAPPTGTIQFLNGTTVLATEPVTSSGATFTTSSLPSTTNSLSAVYSGDFNYGGSTSAVVPYTVQPAPTISGQMPASIAPGTSSFPTPTPFSLTVTDPSSGQSYASTFLALTFASSDGGTLDQTDAELSYQDSAGDWCPMVVKSGGLVGAGDFAGIFTGMGSSCGSPPRGSRSVLGHR